jgi:hypothetical protein
MNKEREILEDIKNTTDDLIVSLYDTKKNISIINAKIKSIDNTYFEEKTNVHTEYSFIYNINSLTDLIADLKQFKYNVEKNLENICNHDWITDYIDITPDRSRKICYCSKCEISKK